MALSVHDLRDIAPGHGKPASGSFLAALDNWPLVRRFGGPLLRFTFTMVASFSLALLVWSMAMSVGHKPKLTADGTPVAEIGAVNDGPAGAKSRNVVERFSVSVSEAVSRFFSSSKKSGKDDTALDNRAMSGGPDWLKIPTLQNSGVASGASSNLDIASLMPASGRAARPNQVPARAENAVSPGVAPPASPAVHESSGFREIKIEKTPKPLVQPARSVNSTATDQTAKQEAPTRTFAVANAPPAQPTTSQFPPPATAIPVAKAKILVQPSVSQDEESSASASIRVAQSDFRRFDEARNIVRALVAKYPGERVAADFDTQLSSLADLRRNAIAERMSLDPAKDKFEAARVDDETGAVIAACVARIEGLASVVIARKTINIQPAIPAYVIVAEAPNLPKNKSAKRDEMLANINNCVAPLHIRGSAAVFLGGEAAGGPSAFGRIKATTGAMVWKH